MAARNCFDVLFFMAERGFRFAEAGRAVIIGGNERLGKCERILRWV